MKKMLMFAVTAIFSIMVLSGCTRSSYAIYTHDGRTIVSKVKPAQTSAGLLGYTDANGAKQQINPSEVKEISEIP
ncbi:YgdI/YgdR family lipoprotein [Yokenella regensburgei]|uniref:YgdI/YgdR family lipoprotein n=1 Tax=Yokenella regensburgei TaxID=158877 RepID=UPI003ED88A6A